MKVKVSLAVKPFIVQEDIYLIADQGEGTTMTVKISALSSEDLEKMCDDFRDSIFKKAGKIPPPAAAPLCSICREPT